jgi:hypothetical protein
MTFFLLWTWELRKSKQKGVVYRKWERNCWRRMWSESHTRKAIGRLGRYGPKNTASMSLLHGETWRGLQANHQRITSKLAKELPKLSPGRDPIRARTSPGCPRSAGKPRAPSLVVDQGMNNMEIGEESKRGRSRLICCVWRLDRWELNRPWSSHIYIYREGGLIPVGNLFNTYFLSFPRPKTDLETNWFEIWKSDSE